MLLSLQPHHRHTIGLGIASQPEIRNNGEVQTKNGSDMRRFLLILSSISLAACGSPSSKLNNENPDGETPVNSYVGPANSQYEPPPPPTGGGGGWTGGGSYEQRFVQGTCEYLATCDAEDFDFGSAAECVAQYEADPDAAIEPCAEIVPATADDCLEQLNGLQCEGFLENFPAICEQAIDYSNCEGENNGNVESEPIDPEPVNDEPDTVPACDEDQVLAELEEGEPVCLDTCPDDVCDSGFVCQSGICLPEQ